MARFALLVLVAGCWASTPPPAPPREPEQTPPPVTSTYKSRRKSEPSRCTRAIDNVLEKFRAELDRMGIMAELVRDAAIQSCEIAEWTDEATSCFETSTDFTAITECRKQLSGEQMKDLDTRMRDALNPTAP